MREESLATPGWGGGLGEKRENAEGSPGCGDAVRHGFSGSLLALRYRWMDPARDNESLSLVWICGYLYIIQIILAVIGPKITN